jgi:hypothetical protein
MKTTPLFIVAALCGTTYAQATDVNAEALFREGRRLMKAGKLAQACDKLEASERLDDSVGTLLNLGDCREKNDQLATAWATFLRASSSANAKHDAREAVAKQHAASLEPKLASLTISVPEASHIDWLVIERDGEAVDPALWNQGVPVDLGSYTIRAAAPGYETWSTRVDVRLDGVRTDALVPRLQPLPKPIAPKVAAPVDRDPEPEPEPESRLTTLRKLSIGTAVLGAAAIAGGVHYGIVAKDLDRQANAVCPGTVCGDPHALSLNHAAQHDALAAEMMLGAGGAAVAGAVVMWLVGAPGHATVVPTGGDGEAGVVLVGSF